MHVLRISLFYLQIRINQEDVKLFALLAEDNLGEPDPVNPHYKPETRESKPEVVVESTRSSSLGIDRFPPTPFLLCSFLEIRGESTCSCSI